MMLTHYSAHAHIDYISLTIVPPQSWGDLQPDDHRTRALLALEYLFDDSNFAHAVDQQMATLSQGLHGFKYRMSWEDSGVFVQWGANHGKVHIVMSGAGCAIVKQVLIAQTDDSMLRRLFDPLRSKLTRLDVAVDVMTDEQPTHVMRWVSPRKGTAYSLIESQTGETVTLGGRSGERYLRIYKYRPPHPRAHLLRWEWELKGNHAVMAGTALHEGSPIKSIVGGLLKPYGITYAPLLGLIGETPPTPLSYQKRGDGGSTMWLFKVCIPALRDALADGIIEPDVLRRYLKID